MGKKEIGKSPFSQLDHVTVAVTNLKQAVKFYSSVGMGPFKPPARHDFAHTTLRNKPLNSKVMTKEAWIGPVFLQLVQQVEGESLVSEFIRRKGEGVFHLGFVVANIDEAEDKAVKMGLKVTQRGRRVDGSGYAFFDTEALAGITLEIKEEPRE